MLLGEAVAERIMALCAEKGMSINRLAALAGLAQSTVDSILKGKSRNPRLSTVIRIAQALGLTVDEFLDDPLIRAALDGEST